MRVALRRALPVTLAVAFGASLGALPALAGPEAAPSVTAVNVGLYSHYWSPEKSSVAVGGQVTLSNPTTTRHGIYWVSGPAVPGCTAGVPVGTSEAAAGTEWNGVCTFATAGVYTFYCTVHGAAMSGSVTVGSAGTSSASTTTTAPPPPATTTPATTTAPSAGAPQAGATPTGGERSPLVGSPSRALELGAGPHGRSVRGSLAVSAAGAGARLEVDVLLARAAVAAVGAPKQLRVGRIVHARVAAGRVAFSVALDARAHRALGRRHRLVVSVAVLLTPPHAHTLKVSRAVVLRR
jgi:plastocyanin